MKVLVVGFGSAGRRHARNLLEMRHEVTVHDPVLTKPPGPLISDSPISIKQAEYHRETEWGYEHNEPNYWDGMDNVTHVLIASPAMEHSRQGIEAVDAGKEVFIEKPVAKSLPNARCLAAMARERGKTVAVGYQMRRYVEMATGQTAQALRNHGTSVRVEYYGDRRKWGGGIGAYEDLLLECSHAIDLLAWSIGPYWDTIVEDAIVTGERAHVRGSGHPGVRWEITLDWRSNQDLHRWTFGENVVEYDPRRGRDAAMLNLAYYDEVARWLAGNPICTAEDGVRVLEVIEAIREAAK